VRPIWIAVGPYLLLVVGGGALLIAYRTPANWRATHALPKNHLIVKDDLKRSAKWWHALGFGLPDESFLEGRYLKSEIKADKPVQPSNVALEPSIQLNTGQSVIWLPLKDQLFPNTLLDAGTKVELCVPGKSCLAATIGALYCDKKTPASCTAAIVVPMDDRQKLIAVDGKNNILFSVPTN
jgi:hypothetical protein